TDDHARNHAGFWDGEHLTLTPAYDICPQSRTGNLASQAMLIVGDNRMSALAACLEAAPNFQLSGDAAKDIIDLQIGTIRDGWDDICKEAELSEVERNLFSRRMFLNDSIFEGTAEDLW
ncbi:MAG: HipA domain-containing protein, partial [Gammaproteobacteria bacterium]|nr:HipA domain-containing protein [Gammaproteobacteria bacterium]